MSAPEESARVHAGGTRAAEGATATLSAGLPVSTPLHGQPRDADGPVFREPWQAQAFAITLALYERGLFSWSEWAAALAAQIDDAQAAGDADLGDTYYHHWLAALETLVAAKQLASTDELDACGRAWRHAAEHTPHGQPIVLQASDHQRG